MKHAHALVLPVIAAGLAACGALGGSRERAPDPVQKTAPIAVEPVLYARDGSIVAGAAKDGGASVPRRDIQESDGSRSRILELYQRVVDERDRLSLEAIARDAELAHARTSLENETARAAAAEQRLQAAEQKCADLASQNLDLAARLTTAQIRRLEAEKKWLEAALAQAPRSLAAIQADAPAARESAKPETAKPATDAPEKH